MPKEIQLTQGQVAIVDDEDYERVNQYKWQATTDKHNWYAKRSSGFHNIKMHRFILDAQRGTDVDHIDGNGLNNTRANLRIATHSQNLANRKLDKNNTSGHKGVTWSKGMKKWAAQIEVMGKHHHLGYFEKVEDAAQAYQRAAREKYGEFANW